jgi:hypothetical protein
MNGSSFGVLPKADRSLAGAWWLVLMLRGVLPAVFAIAMGVLVGAVQRTHDQARAIWGALRHPGRGISIEKAGHYARHELSAISGQLLSAESR